MPLKLITVRIWKLFDLKCLLRQKMSWEKTVKIGICLHLQFYSCVFIPESINVERERALFV